MEDLIDHKKEVPTYNCLRRTDITTIEEILELNCEKLS